MNRPIILINPLSVRSLRLELYFGQTLLGRATGFLVQKDERSFLVTNWHVVSGYNPDTGRPLADHGGIPDRIEILHHARGNLGTWIPISQPLVGPNGQPLWVEHPSGRVIDVILLPVVASPAADLHYFDLRLSDTDMVPEPAIAISIIGFPYGLGTAGAWPIWKTGHVASDPDLDYDGRPAFLIDATTRGGMSGSPVVWRCDGGYRTRNGTPILAGGMKTKFLGVYSGRIHDDAEIGRVWRPSVVEEILSNA